MADTTEQPAIPRDNSGVSYANHLAVRESLQIALHASFERCGPLYLLLVTIVGLGVVLLAGWSEVFYEKHKDDQCDMPLALMLRMVFLIGLLNLFKRDIVRCLCCFDRGADGPTVPNRVILFRRFCCLLVTFWPITAAYELWQTKVCSRDLVVAVRGVLIYYVAAVVIIIVMPIVVLSVMLCLVRRGFVRSAMGRGGAPDGFVNELPVIPFDPALFDDNKPDVYSTACPICLDDFDSQRPICRTPCGNGVGHAFHQSCISGWLGCSRSCPLCRVDLPDAVSARQDFAPGVPASAAAGSAEAIV
eukprot:TRINITY_DN42790_c0_g1_i1.p1 TRINITY_DN42790_c0_g1~~TRINITY_DN42790_c0_g1_i1.p1  ORF type:complete len:303 (+),score=31.96 TRINITY_DN42790_c0_g1_i1:101-1009(+)